ncbi:MAG: HlyD family efflux transporter periplasmic adaptor subunit [Pseudomonadota bacterium]
MTGKKTNRRIATFAIVAVVGGALAWAFWPRAVLVDMDKVTSGEMIVTINDEGRTQVHEPYILSTPMAGRLLRVQVEPGDEVVMGETVVAHMLPSNPDALDIRSLAQAQASVASAEAALEVSRAQLKATIALDQKAQLDVDRTRRLASDGTVSETTLELAETSARATREVMNSAQAEIALREADVANARADLISYGDDGYTLSPQMELDSSTPILAPITGRVLQVIEKSETTLDAGTPILEFGNVDSDLEVVAELLSTDAVKVEEGARVIIDNWGGGDTLSGEVVSVDPWGYTKYSALGVEEQRVDTRIALTDPPETYAALGHGYRVEVKIVVWEKSDATIVPVSALFHHNGGSAVYKVEDGRVEIQPVVIEESNGVEASVTDGLNAGDAVIVYPAPGLSEGTRVEARS